MSPRITWSRGSAMMRFVNQSDPACILVKRASLFHRTRLPVEAKCFDLGMGLAPFGKGPADTALLCHIKFRGETADVVQNDDPASCECGIPKFKLHHGCGVFMRAVDDDQLRGVSKIGDSRGRRLGIEGIAFRDLDEVLET